MPAGMMSAGDAEWVIKGDSSDVDRAVADGLKSVQKGTKDWKKASSALGKGFIATGAAITGVGAIITGTLGSAVKESSSFESAFAGIRKTVDATEPEFQAMRDQILGLSTEIPVAATELAGIGEIAGQLGIQKENIVAFSKTIADLSVSSNIAGEEGALMVAQFMNITGTPQEMVGNLASAIVDLGNNSATTENDILTLGARIAASGELAGMTEGDILGIAAALSSVGVEAAMGGTAISQTIRMMNDDFLAGEEEMTKWADVAGVTAEEFHKQWSEKPAEALASFVVGLKRIDEEGGSVTATVDELGLKGIRLADVMGRMTLTADDFEASIQRGNEAYAENTALTEEATKRYKTMESKAIMLKNAVVALAVKIGDVLLPPLTKFLEFATKIVKKVIEWTKAHPELTATLVKVAAAIGAAALVIGPIVIAIGAAILAVGGLVAAIGAMISGGAIVPIILGAITVAIGIVSAATAFMATQWKKFKPIIMEFLEKLQQKWIEVKPILIEVLEKVWDSAKKILDIVGKLTVKALPLLLDAYIIFIDSVIWGLKAINWLLEKMFWLSDTVGAAYRVIGAVFGMGQGGGDVVPDVVPIGGQAKGGPITKTGMYTVGELGPEVVLLPKGAHVIPYLGGLAGGTVDSSGEVGFLEGEKLAKAMALSQETMLANTEALFERWVERGLDLNEILYKDLMLANRHGLDHIMDVASGTFFDTEEMIRLIVESPIKLTPEEYQHLEYVGPEAALDLEGAHVIPNAEKDFAAVIDISGVLEKSVMWEMRRAQTIQRMDDVLRNNIMWEMRRAEVISRQSDGAGGGAGATFGDIIINVQGGMNVSAQELAQEVRNEFYEEYDRRLSERGGRP